MNNNKPMSVAGSLALGLFVALHPATTNAQETVARRAEILHEYTLPSFSLQNFGYTAEELAAAQVNGAVTDLPALGSGLQRSMGNHYISITDRGPTFDRNAPSGSKAFPIPQFNPTIVLFKAVADRIVPTGFLSLLNDLDQPVTGLPNGPADDAPGYLTVTAPVDQAFPPNHDGLDPEDLHTLPGGGFIVVEEYSPSIVIVGPTGNVLRRYVPQGKTWLQPNYPVKAILPAELGFRRANRGLESLAVSPDGRTAYAVMQSPLGPTATGSPQRDSRVVRILRMDISDPLDLKVTGEFLYFFQPLNRYPLGNNVRDLKISAAAWVAEDKILILERTDKGGAGGAKLVLVDVANATDVTGVGLSLENASADLSQLGVTPATSSVVLDVNAEIPTITDFKLEGLAILNNNDVSISNDNDFGIGDVPGRSTRMFTIRLSQSLR